MQTSTAIPLIRKSDGRPLVDVLQEVGAPVERILDLAGLPPSFEEGGDGFIPFRRMLQFAGHAARSQGIPDLCWQAVQRSRPEHLGGWGEAVERCTTVRRAALTFCESFHRDAPLMKLGLTVGAERVWFWRRRPRQVLGWLGDEEGQQYALSALVRCVRRVAGPEWTPSAIQLESDNAPWLETIREFAGIPVHLNAPVVGIALPYTLLDQADRPRTGSDPADRCLEPAEETLAGSLRQAFASLLPAVDPSLEVAAEIAEISPRTLRRRLAREETTWRRVRDEARLLVCEQLLHDRSRTLAEIAAELRYSDQAHLTRAFKRWTGECPTEFRLRHSAGGRGERRA